MGVGVGMLIALCRMKSIEDDVRSRKVGAAGVNARVVHVFVVVVFPALGVTTPQSAQK